MEERFLTRRVPTYAWGLIVGTGLIWLGIGAVFYVPFDTAFLNGPLSAYSAQALSDLTNTSRLLAVLLMQGGLLLVALGFSPFRAGLKWAWYAVATVPIMGILASYIVYLGKGTVISSVILFIVLPSLGLFVPLRSFFPAKTKIRKNGVQASSA